MAEYLSHGIPLRNPFFDSAGEPHLARSDQWRSARLPKRPSEQGWPVELREGALRLRRTERKGGEHACASCVSSGVAWRARAVGGAQLADIIPQVIRVSK